MNQSVTINFIPGQVITWIIVGLLAGLMASFLFRGRLGFIGSVVVGLLGALLGGFLATIFHINVASVFPGGITLSWADIVVAFVGALIILLLFGGVHRRYYGRRRREVIVA